MCCRMRHLADRIFCVGTRALPLFIFLAACGRRPDPPTLAKQGPAPSSNVRGLARVAVGNLYAAYIGGSASADAVYRGKRYTIIGQVVAANVDAGASQLVLGSKLEPVIATGVEKGAAASLVIGSAIELDCTVTGAVAEIPTLDCGPNGMPRPVSTAQ